MAIAARLVVSESGDILSPITAPATIAPSTGGSGTSSPMAIPMRATPAVPAEVQDEPVAMDNTEQINREHSIRNFGFIMYIP
ncbi:hypothetical protein SDC9_167667 [bioreactor metagenome]|uniref:Uncharacterized protein n=1 Tax=bioreactor metagenome TaxID=1076179 RepID=A0A645G393_9ZZZZ